MSRDFTQLLPQTMAGTPASYYSTVTADNGVYTSQLLINMDQMNVEYIVAINSLIIVF